MRVVCVYVGVACVYVGSTMSALELFVYLAAAAAAALASVRCDSIRFDLLGTTFKSLKFVVAPALRSALPTALSLPPYSRKLSNSFGSA